MTPVAASPHTIIPKPVLMVSGIWVDRVKEVFQSSSAPEDGHSRFQTTVSRWDGEVRQSLTEVATLRNVSSQEQLPNDESMMSDEQWNESGYSDAIGGFCVAT